MNEPFYKLNDDLSLSILASRFLASAVQGYTYGCPLRQGASRMASDFLRDCFFTSTLRLDLRLDLLISSGDVVLRKLALVESSYERRTPWTAVSFIRRTQLTGPTDDKTGLVASLRLWDHVEVNVVHLLVGDTAIVLRISTILGNE